MPRNARIQLKTFCPSHLKMVWLLRSGDLQRQWRKKNFHGEHFVDDMPRFALYREMLGYD